jgi:hypothetical protein
MIQGEVPPPFQGEVELIDNTTPPLIDSTNTLRWWLPRHPGRRPASPTLPFSAGGEID